MSLNLLICKMVKYLIEKYLLTFLKIIVVFIFNLPEFLSFKISTVSLAVSKITRKNNKLISSFGQRVVGEALGKCV